MSDTIGNVTNENGFTEASNEDLPLEAILEEIQEAKAEKENNTINTTDASVDKTYQEKEMSPLEKLRAESESGTMTGMVVSNQALETGKDGAVQATSPMEEFRTVDMEETLNEMDETYKKRQAAVIIKEPTDQVEYIQMIEEIEAIYFEDGHAKLPKKVDSGGNETPYEYIRLRKENEPMYDKKFDDIIKQHSDESQNIKGVESDLSESENSGKNEEEKKDEKSPEMKKIVEVLIDKTGFGGDFKFTEEEKEKIEESDLIRLKEVKVIDIASIKTKRSDKSFQETVKDYDLTGSKVAISFPASGFKAEMKGMTYGEYADVALDLNNVTFDQYYKRLSVIYNKMVNISTGPFADFEDFLKNFAYTDISLAVYAMYIASESEEADLPLRCGNCHNGFKWNFKTRNLLRLDRCSDTFLKGMKELAIAPAMEYDSIRENSAVQNSKLIELPGSKFIVEIGIASAYDFLYNFIPLMNEETFTEAFGTISAVYAENTILLTALRKIYVPDGTGEYIICEGYKDILDALYNVKPEDIKTVYAYSAAYMDMYETVFSLGDPVCPHCKTVTKQLDINIDDLVFRRYRQLTNINVDLSKLQDL